MRMIDYGAVPQWNKPAKSTLRINRKLYALHDDQYCLTSGRRQMTTRREIATGNLILRRFESWNQTSPCRWMDDGIRCRRNCRWHR